MRVSMARHSRHMSSDSFVRLVEQAMADVPFEYARLLDSVAVVVENEPPLSVLNDLEIEEGEELLGLHHGRSLNNESFFRPVSHSFARKERHLRRSHSIAGRFSGSARRMRK